MINLLSKTGDFVKNDEFANKKWKGVISGEKKRYFRWFAVSTCPPGQVLAGPDMSDFRLLIKFAFFGFKICFLKNFINDFAWFCLEKLKNIFFNQKTLKK